MIPDVEAVDDDSACRFGKSKDHLKKAAFSSSFPTDDAKIFARSNVAVEILQGKSTLVEVREVHAPVHHQRWDRQMNVVENSKKTQTK